ncbi:fungal specific transcription factor domain-containing protein [Stagonosporopsis vannaccii]|nr:fungal specific transcription factor domain-containing protein [Stagonosporopsis vannaccii]
MYLPPLEQIMPVIHKYLQEFNPVLPLFHASTLLRMVRDCYSLDPPNRDPVVCAAIYTVLGLVRRHRLGVDHEIPSTATCLRRAESMLSRVVLGEVQLLNIQVLVGMAMLLQASQDLKPALVLIGTTMRLAHRIGLHDRTYSAHLDDAHARQRACVFWLAYILDKNLSMRSKQPSVQNDDDIDLELPSQTVLHDDEDRTKIIDVNDASGTITTNDGIVKMNYLTARIHLAVVEGGVYDYIHSTRSRKRSPEERSHALQSIEYALEQWKASIPPEFGAAASLGRVSRSTLRFLGVLHSTSLACTTQINQAHAWNSEWMTSIQTYGRQGIAPILPPRWEVLVDEARDLLALYETLGEIGRSNFWTTGCSYMTAMVLLTVNNMHRPRHSKLPLDDRLVEAGLEKVSQLASETDSQTLQSFQAGFTEIFQHTQQKSAAAVGLQARSTMLHVS